MAIDTNVQEFTDAELLKLVNKAIADILVAGQSQSQRDRATYRATLDSLFKQKADLESRVAGDDSNGGNVLVQYGERV